KKWISRSTPATSARAPKIHLRVQVERDHGFQRNMIIQSGGTLDPECSVVLCAVRARGHGRAHPRQDRRLEEEGDVDGRRAAARVSGAGPKARHHRQRGGNCSLDLSPLCRTRLGPAFEGRARSPKDRPPIVDERFGSPRRRQAVLTRRALPDLAEPYLSGIRSDGNKIASSRSRQ